jgi:hypothetical protein
MELVIISSQEHIKLLKANNKGGKPQDYWDRVIGWYEVIANGDAGLSHPLMR